MYGEINKACLFYVYSETKFLLQMVFEFWPERGFYLIKI